MKKFAILFFLLSLPSHAAVFGPPIIGGAQIGLAGNGGIYSGYTLAGGDDFNGPLNVVNTANPNAYYFSTIAYEAGARGTTGLLGDQYDNDPYNSGNQDANRGVALGSTNMSESNSILSLQARIENGGETGLIGSGRTLITAMIHTGGYLTYTPPCIIEARIRLSSGAISGWHPTFWMLNSSPVNSGTGQINSLEFDFEPNTYDGSTSTAISANYLAHGTVPGWTTDHLNTANLFDGNYHILSFVMTASSMSYYIDGALNSNISGDTTVLGKPYYALFTNHIINPQSISDWTTTGAAGKTQSVDWYRVWIPTTEYPSQVIQPTQNLPNIQVAYNTSMTYTIPSATVLWGSAITDYCQGIKFEDYEPGSNVAFAGNYIQWPAGLTWNSSTRILTGVTSDLQPGRIHTACVPNVAGGSLGYTARGYIDIGPNVTETTASYSNGAGSLDMYFVGNCGTLLPKTISITGLPSGLSFSQTTNLITGTATPGTYTISFGVTNSVGQNATQNIALTVGS